ncbi:hypothetical protein ACFE04_012159 [Oxalis oulophora]
MDHPPPPTPTPRIKHKSRRKLLLSCLQSSPSSSGVISFAKPFSYKELKRATDDFSRLIYTNPYGTTAYKARFPDGTVVLLKEISLLHQQKGDFYRDVQLLAHLHHRHLLSLRGFSVGHKRFLVFDNIDNGTLKEHLNDPLRTPLNWKTRLEIASGVAAALEYLLLFSGLPKYHVSVNSSNIMLDENFTAKLSDVSLLCSDINYITMQPTSSSEDETNRERNDIIYQLGILILELVTGQSSDQEDGDLLEWISGSRFGSAMHKMIDPDLGNNYDSRELRNLLSVARLCIKSGDKLPFSAPQGKVTTSLVPEGCWAAAMFSAPSVDWNDGCQQIGP